MKEKDFILWVSMSKGVRFGLLFIAFLLIEVLPSACSSFFASDNRLATVSVINGEVLVSDGISEIAAKEGPLIPRDVRTLLKTGEGNAILTMPDGSFVILDTNSTIEFNRNNEQESDKPFAFNLVSGRAMVINGQDSQSPIQVFVGGHIAVQVFRAAMGLQVQTESETRERVDCLEGSCQVSGNYLLKSGQNARIGQDNTIVVTEGVAYNTWRSLGKSSKPGSVLLNLFTSIFPTITPTITLTALPQAATPTFSITVSSTVISSPSPTSTIQLTATPTPTITKTPLPPYSSPTPTPTQREKRERPPEATPTLIHPTLPPPPGIVPQLSARP